MSQTTDQTTQPRRAVAYIRESTEEQGRGYSPDGQRQAIGRYAAEHGMQLAEEYLDFETGRLAEKRRGFQRLIEDAMERRFEVVLVFHTSRFARNTVEAKRYKKLLRSELGIEVISVTQPLGADAEDPAAFLSESVHEIFDEYYSVSLSFWIKMGLREKARQGRLTGTLPWGYVKGEDGIATPDPARAPYVRQLFEMYATREHTDHTCDQPIAKAQQIERQLVQFITGFTPSPGIREEILRRLAGTATPESAETTQRRTALQERLSRTRDLYEIGDLTRPEYISRRDAINTELNTLAPQPTPDLDQAQKVLEDFSLFWQNEQDPNAKRRFLSLIFQGVWIDEHRIVAVQPKPSFLPFFESRRQTAAAVAGVNDGSDGGQTHVRHLRWRSARGPTLSVAEREHRRPLATVSVLVVPRSSVAACALSGMCARASLACVRSARQLHGGATTPGPSQQPARRVVSARADGHLASGRAGRLSRALDFFQGPGMLVSRSPRQAEEPEQ